MAHARQKMKLCRTEFWGQIMANGWTPGRRAQQAELIQRWRPWGRSTGPETEEGKQRSAMRGHKGGLREQLHPLARLF